MTGVLDRIVASKRREIEALRAAPPDASGLAARAVVPVLRREGRALRLLAEVKRRSPSAGPLSTALSPGDRAVAYARAGATMVSVLCDGPFFDGAYAHVTEARRALEAAGLSTPVLAKEFVLDEAQVAAARAAGADAVLLIARIVDAATLARLATAAMEIGIEPLVEVATEEELGAAERAGARVVGVNARDLDTLELDAARAGRVLAAIGPGTLAVHLSGLKTPADVASVAASRADAALVGEALMRQDDPEPLLRSLVAACAGGT